MIKIRVRKTQIANSEPRSVTGRERPRGCARKKLPSAIRLRNEEIAERDHKLEKWVLRLIGLEILLSVIGLWPGYQQGKVLDKQTTALIHMDASTAATSDSLQKLVASQDAALELAGWNVVSVLDREVETCPILSFTNLGNETDDRFVEGDISNI